MAEHDRVMVIASLSRLEGRLNPVVLNRDTKIKALEALASLMEPPLRGLLDDIACDFKRLTKDAKAGEGVSHG